MSEDILKCPVCANKKFENKDFLSNSTVICPFCESVFSTQIKKYSILNNFDLIDKIKHIVFLIDNVTDFNIIASEIKACDEIIRNGDDALINKINLFWNGGVMGILNMTVNLNEAIRAISIKSNLPMIRIHLINTINTLSDWFFYLTKHNQNLIIKK